MVTLGRPGETYGDSGEILDKFQGESREILEGPREGIGSPEETIEMPEKSLGRP